MPVRRAAILATLSGLALPLSAPAQSTPGKPIAPWERAAVELAVAYLDRGPESWWERLAPGSPLAGLSRGAAAGEIEARVGPEEGVVWTLQTVVEEGASEGTAVFHLQFPSGLDDLLVLELVPDGDRWALADLRSWAEPSPGPGSAPSPSQTPATQGGPHAGEAGSPGSGPRLAEGSSGAAGIGEGLSARRLFAGAAGLALLGLGIGLGLAPRAAAGRRPVRRLAFAAAAVGLGLAGLALTLRLARPGAPSGGAGEGESSDSLAPLVELRRALATPEGEASLPALFAAVVPAGRAAAVARLWQIQALLQSGDLNGADRLLATLPSPAREPLAEVLRGRLAFLRGEETAAVLAFENALAALPDPDGLALEAAEALAQMGFEQRGSDLLGRLAAAGSREAATYYLLARVAALAGDDQAAAERLRWAWSLSPVVRESLLGDRVYGYVVRKGGLFDLLGLAATAEPVVVAPGLGAQALAVPAGFEATAQGRRLRLARGGAEVVIPGGSDLAPAGTRVEDAAARRRREEERALAQLAELTRVNRSAEGPTQPVLRQRLATASLALSRRNRWAEVAELTEAFAARPERLPLPLAQLRAEALSRTGREEEATAFLIHIARSNLAQRRRDPDALFRLADLLVEAAEYDLAVRVTRTAELRSPEPPLASAIPRIQMEKRLATSYAVHESRHFLLRYPGSGDRRVADSLSAVLERELTRVQRWIPYRPPSPIEVHLFPPDEFFDLYSQDGEALGVFDGKVRVPLAEVRSLHPFVVSILTHELAHALIAGATGDQAPAWLHEGLAQHVQMVQNRINPVPGYRDRGTLVAFPLLEPILQSRSDPELTAVAYDEACWIAHFLESRHGPEIFGRLLAAFGRGATTEQALGEVLGASVPEFDAAVWRWALSEAPAAWSTRIIRYDRGG